MARFAVCPYYGCSEDMCDVGCGYISTHDASQISRYCSAEYQACPKFSELVDRYADEAARLPDARIPLQKTPPGFVTGEAGVATGLAATGMAILLYAFQTSGFSGVDARLTGSLIMLISIVQMVVGMVAMKKRPMRGMMFIGAGLLWASLLALDLLPADGFGTPPSRIALSGYLYFWGMFCLFPLQSAIHVSPTCRTFFGMFAAYLFLQAATPYFMIPLQVASMVIGGIAGLIGIGAGLRYAIQHLSDVAEPAVVRSRRPR